MKSKRAWLIFLIFLNGYVSLSLELVVLRQLAFYVGSSAVITSIIMGTFLGFMSLGYFMGQSKKITARHMRPILGVSFLIIALFAMLAATFPFIDWYFNQMYQAKILSSTIQTFIFSGALLSVGPFLFGFNTTILSRMLHEFNTSFAGSIMAMDTIGSVMGSMVTTLLLMPFIGVNYTVMMVVALALLCAIVSWRKWYVAIGVVAIFAVTAYYNSDYIQRTRYGILVNNANSTISVAEINDLRILYMNSLPMSMYNARTDTTAPYIDYINENFLYTMPRDRMRHVLVLGAGGFTAGLRDTFHDYTFVDIEHTLRDVAQTHFLGEQLTSNKRFIVQDASQFLKNTQMKYDVILLDVYSNSYQIPEGLITAEFMQRIKARVADDGIILMNVVTGPAFTDRFARVFDNTFHAVFPHNTGRQVIDRYNPWGNNGLSNVIYVWYNRDTTDRIYTINKTPVIYDAYK